MLADITSFAERKLGCLVRFKPRGLPLVTSVDLPYSLAPVPLREHENVLGVYENIANSLTDALVFTGTRFHIAVGDDWQSCDYGDISSVTYAKFTPERIDTLVVVVLANNSTLRFNVAGFDVHEYGARTFDSYQIGDFLDCAKSRA
ncbi:hypothetical protein [Neorhodopirellula pilleata]|uniref:Uncharacterized protein n=1 Tax=Neorhodopirellula pilleata TaxID=2714738 RepID=A0A5C5ZZE4_9BACT|nr:hypothetical protein [Neorhodopirellula pilleata]TWT92942.1 hypothetical protein Pla100_42580 [Neorhodopirellula pilleata]